MLAEVAVNSGILFTETMKVPMYLLRAFLILPAKVVCGMILETYARFRMWHSAISKPRVG